MSDMSRVPRDALVANIRGIARCADQYVDLAEDAERLGSPEMSRVLLHFPLSDDLRQAAGLKSSDDE
jgi:hypothetical protein